MCGTDGNIHVQYTIIFFFRFWYVSIKNLYTFLNLYQHFEPTWKAMRRYLESEHDILDTWKYCMSISFPMFISLPSSIPLSSCTHSFSIADPLSTGQDTILTVPQIRRKNRHHPTMLSYQTNWYHSALRKFNFPTLFIFNFFHYLKILMAGANSYYDINIDNNTSYHSWRNSTSHS